MQEIMTAAPISAQSVTESTFARFVSYIDRPQSERTYITNLRQFMAWMRYTDIQQPQRADIISYREWLQSEHDAIELDPDALRGWTYRTDKKGSRLRVMCKPNTVKQYLQSVKQFFTWAAAEGLYPNISANIHAPKVTDAHRKDSLTARDVRAIETSITAGAQAAQTAAAEARKDRAGRLQRSTEQGKRLFAMYLLAVNAGLRTVEISRAKVKDIEVKGGCTTLYIWGKGHTEPDAAKPLAPAVYDAIRDYLDSRSDSATGAAPLFVSTGNRSRGRAIDPTTISKMLKKAMQAAGYDSDRLTAHSLRHTAGQNVLQITGDNIYKTQMYMRHSSPKTTEIYLDNNAQSQDAGIAARLYEHYHGGQAKGDKLQQAMQQMNPDQLDQLAAIAAAMVSK